MRMWHEGVPGDTGTRPQFHFNPITDEIQPFTDADYFSYMRGVREDSGPERDPGEIPEEVPRMPVKEDVDYYQMELEWRTRMAQGRDYLLNPEEQKVYNDTLIELEYGPGFLRRAHP